MLLVVSWIAGIDLRARFVALLQVSATMVVASSVTSADEPAASASA
jgi:hypothetical protein